MICEATSQFHEKQDRAETSAHAPLQRACVLELHYHDLSMAPPHPQLQLREAENTTSHGQGGACGVAKNCYSIEETGNEHTSSSQTKL